MDADRLAADVNALGPDVDEVTAARRGIRLVLDQLVEDPAWVLEVKALRTYPELRDLFASASRRIEKALFEALRRRFSSTPSDREPGAIMRTTAARRLAMLGVTCTGALRVAITAWVEDPELDLRLTLDQLLQPAATTV